MEPDAAMPMPGDTGRQVILVISDLAHEVAAVQAALSAHYLVVTAANAAAGLQRVKAEPAPVLVLLATALPGGCLAVCREIKASPAVADIPLVLLGAGMSPEEDEAALALGVVDIVSWPLSAPVWRARVRRYLASVDQAAWLAEAVQRRTEEIQSIQEVTIMVLASLAETRDVDTCNHIRRTQLYVKALAEQLATQPRFAARLAPAVIDLIYRAAPLHDIGKVGIPDAVLRKQAHLRPEEFALIKAHTRLGRDAIAHAEKRLGGDVPFLRVAKEIAFCHQEKWDGSGYPQGLRGDAIPLSARLMAVADVYDALITRRVYREPVEHEEAVRLILEGRGRHFDPAVVDAFVTIAPTFRAIARAHADEEDSVATRQVPRCTAEAVPNAQA